MSLPERGAACSFCEQEVTIVAPMSAVSRPPAPGAASPARSRGRSRASARAARLALSAAGAPAASRMMATRVL